MPHNSDGSSINKVIITKLRSILVDPILEIRFREIKSDSSTAPNVSVTNQTKHSSE
jgi:hypothetical protein